MLGGEGEPLSGSVHLLQVKGFSHSRSGPSLPTLEILDSRCQAERTVRDSVAHYLDLSVRPLMP